MRGHSVKDDWVEQGVVLVVDLHVVDRDYIVDVLVRTFLVVHCVDALH